MRVLIDTQIFLWVINNEAHRLSAVAHQTVFDPENELMLSMASVWEIAIKCGTGKLRLPKPLEGFLFDQLVANKVALLPIRFAHAVKVESLPMHHKDPFDRLIAAQAMTEELPVVSSDGALDAYNVRRIWE